MPLRNPNLAITEELLEAVRIIGSGIVGGLIGSFITHRLTLSRERRSGKATRKRNFLAFMRTWQIEIGRTYLESGGFARKPIAFSDVVSSFAGECQSIRGDFDKKKRSDFDALVATVTAFHGAELMAKGGYE